MDASEYIDPIIEYGPKVLGVLKVGDFVEVNGEKGACEHIDLFTCEFRTLDNKKLIIPNGAVFGSTITNYTGYEIRRADIDVGAEYSADVDATRAALEKAAANIPGMIKDPAPQVFLKGLVDRLAGPHLVQDRRFLGRGASHGSSVQGLTRRGRHRDPFPAAGRAPRRIRHQSAVQLTIKEPVGIRGTVPFSAQAQGSRSSETAGRAAARLAPRLTTSIGSKSKRGRLPKYDSM